MKRIQKLSLSIICIAVFVFLTGCVYHSTGWNDMSSEEQEEAYQTFQEIKADLEEDFSNDSTK